LVRGSYYTTLGYDVIYDVFVLFTFAKVEVFWFDTLVTDQRLALLHVLHINWVSDQTFGLRLMFDTLVSAKDKVTHCSNETILMHLTDCHESEWLLSKSESSQFETEFQSKS